MPTLTDEQNAVREEIKKFNKPVQTLGGYAGTGKTTLISQLVEDLQDFAVCAFTGKAANVLRRKGISDASTIHSLIYQPEKDELGNVLLRNGSPVFRLVDNLACRGIIVDEASMVGKDIYNDLTSFGLPVIFVGDHGQLEPVGEGVNLMANPDFTLETIHRNAGEIAYFAEFIRKGNRATKWDNRTGKIDFIGRYDAYDYFTKADQIICAYNKTRVGVNVAVRKKLGYTDNFPQVGEKVMCLKNNKQRGLFNGMQGLVTKTYERPRNKMQFESNDADFEVFFDPKYLHQEKYDFSDRQKGDPEPFDFAYCITAHKAQGDEWLTVMVLEQMCKLWEHKRWAYTAASRAKEQLIWVENY